MRYDLSCSSCGKAIGTSSKEMPEGVDILCEEDSPQEEDLDDEGDDLEEEEEEENKDEN